MFAKKYSVPIDPFPHYHSFVPQTKAPQSDLVNVGLSASEIIHKNKHEIGGIIAFGPQRYDSVFTIAEQSLVPIIYIYPNEKEEKEIYKKIMALPIYPYFTPFITIYFSDVLAALSDAIPKFMEPEEEENE